MCGSQRPVDCLPLGPKRACPLPGVPLKISAPSPFYVHGLSPLSARCLACMNTRISSVKKALKSRTNNIIIIDEHGTIQSLNGIAQDLFHKKHTNTKGHNIEMLIPGICVAAEL